MTRSSSSAIPATPTATRSSSEARRCDIYVYVDDVDAHYERARTAGAEIIDEPEDQVYGERRYGAVDPEGHRWYFSQVVREVTPEDWGAEVTSPS